jgi:cell division septation protein DedD
VAAAVNIRRKDEASAVVVPTIVDAKGLPQKIDITDVLTTGSSSESLVSPEPPEAVSVLSDDLQLSAQRPVPVFQKQRFTVQLAAFSSPENAEVSRKYWQAKGLSVYVALIRDDQAKPWYAIRTGEFALRREASALALQLGRKESVGAMVVSAEAGSAGKPEAPNLPSPVVASEVAESRQGAPQAPLVKPAVRLVRYTIQLGVFASIDNAAKAFAEWQSMGYEPYVTDAGEIEGKPRFSVRTGDYLKKREAQSMSRIIERQDGKKTIVVPAVLLENGQLSRMDVTPLLDNPVFAPSADMTGNNVR